MEFYRWLQNKNVAETTIKDEFNPWPQLKPTLGKWFRVVLAVIMAVAMFVIPIQTVSAAPTIQFIDSGQSLGSSRSFEVSLADLDGDGDLDAFVANYGQPNKVWLNDGSGNFTDSQQALGNSDSSDVSLADVDGDGDLDAFVTNEHSQPNKVWLNDGSGNFTDSQQALGNYYSNGVSLGDVDGDGDLDAFVTNSSRNDEVWLNDGSGNFTDSQQALGNSTGMGVSLTDVDGDGDLDAFVAEFFQKPDKVWLNDGSGNFTDSHQALGNSSSVDVSSADVDGDGDLDAFFTAQNLYKPNKLWLNDGSGNFTDSHQAVGNSKSRSVTLGDVDGDGDIDAFVDNLGQPNKVWLNDGKGNFTGSQQVSKYGSRDLTLGDVDGDGDLDAFMAIEGQNKVWLNNLDVVKKQACDNTAPNNLVVNGSFEEPKLDINKGEYYRFVDGSIFGGSLKEWDLVEGVTIELDHMYVGYPGYKGSQFIDLDSLGDQRYGTTTTKISQKIATQPGEIYKLTFAFKGSGKSTTEHDKLNVYWGSELVEALDKLDNDTTWEEKTYNLTAKSTETVLSFDNLNEVADGYGTRLDGVSLNLCQ